MRRLLVIAALLLVGRPAGAQVEPPVPVPAPSLSVLTVALQYVDDPTLHEELKLSEDQVRRLVRHADRWFQEYGALSTSQRNAQMTELSKASDKALGEILKPEQLRRLKQLTLQMAARRFGDERAVRHPEVAEALGLTAEQATLLRVKKLRIADALTKEQQVKWAEMTGQPVRWVLQMSKHRLPFGSGAVTGVGGPMVILLPRYRSVQQELKLTAEQIQRLQSADTTYRNALAIAQGLEAAAQAKAVAEAARAVEKAVDAVLKPEQSIRLRQIAFQASIRERGWGEALNSPLVKNELRLSTDQLKQLVRIDADRARRLEALLAKEGDFDAFARALAEYGKETQEEIRKVLDAEQQAKWKDVAGVPFTGEVGGWVPSWRAASSTASVSSLVSTGMATLNTQPIKTELKLTADQLKKLNLLYEQFSMERAAISGEANLQERTTRLLELHKKSDAEVAGVLTADQFKRFKEIRLQTLTRSTTVMLPNYPDVVEELKLTEEQQDRLRVGVHLADVLTRKQKLLWEKMIGPPYKGIPPPTRPVTVMSRTPATLFALTHKTTLDELKLPDDQWAKLRPIQDGWRDRGEPLYSVSPATDPEAEKKLSTLVKEVEGTVAALLTAEQKDRLQEIERRRIARTGLDELFDLPEVEKELALTNDQRNKIESMMAEAEKLRQLILREIGSGGPATALEEKLDRATEKRVLAALTDRQRAALEKLLGKPVKGPLLATTSFGVPMNATGVSAFAPPR